MLTSTKDEARFDVEGVIDVVRDEVEPLKSSLLGELVTLARDNLELLN